MFYRNLALSTAVAAMTAFAAPMATAQSVPVVQSEGVLVDGSSAGWEAVIADDVLKSDLGPKEEANTDENDNYENILAHAEPGKEVRTSDNELIGTVVETRNYPELGPVLMVDVSAMGDLPVEMIGLTYDVVNVMESGELQYHSEMEFLRANALDKL
ncbi:hypothetical protein K1T73_10910 [Roseovarius sp. SCSIO 43702]|uniref:hypothetical protein n=1 Tax=Roseovarius sp. SCSIO 43702 TaxID=2823043 RepID=UPI001C73A26C|nr:hypothetical protein [Roseovarius sp. SCSIO 43702]QYX55600.1 hypothetical protein K1T73_10910 [Roseovarius sp. SCSIO 43702]